MATFLEPCPGEPSIAAVQALDGKIFAALTPDEETTLTFYRRQGRKFGIQVSITHVDVDADALARTRSEEQVDQVLKRTNCRVAVRNARPGST